MEEERRKGIDREGKRERREVLDTDEGKKRQERCRQSEKERTGNVLKGRKEGRREKDE